MLRIYKASAGSGKTYTLTKRYITLLLSDKTADGGRRLVKPGTRGRHRSILAVTFTNKATDEMKRRIVHELAVLAGMERGWTGKSPYLDEMTRELRCTPEEIADRASTALRDLLHAFGFFNVSTIDSFFQSVLRTFAREAELPGNYELDLDDDAAVRIGINEMLQSINREPENDGQAADNRRLEHWIEMLMTDLITKGKGFNIFNRNTDVHQALVNFVRGISDETYVERRDEIDRYLSSPERLTKLTAALNERINEVKEMARRAAAAAQQCEGMTKLAESQLEKWAAQGYVKPTSGTSLPATVASMAENPEKAFKKSPGPTAGGLAAVAAAGRAIAESHATVPLLTDIVRQLYVLGLTGRINGYIAQFRAESSTLLLSDTNAILSRIIGPDSTPFIYERTGQWINHFLIDEFQDTSRLQWHNLTPLIEESLATDNDNLVIGDEKQCIYRFRNSDPSLLHNLHTDYGRRAAVEGDDIKGNTNWRSGAPVVRFNNTFFRAMAALSAEGSELAEIYSNVTQQIAPGNVESPGYVLLEPYGEMKNTDEMRQAAFEHTAAHISRQIASGYAPGDIAVLFRKGKDAAKFIEFILNRTNTDRDFPAVKVMSDESLLVSRSRAVRLVISVLRVLAAKGYATSDKTMTDRESAELLNRYEYRLSCGDVPEKALAAALSGEESVSPEISPEKVAEMECLTLVSVIERIIAGNLTETQQREENVYLTALTDMGMDMSARGVNDLPTFLKWWDDRGRLTAVAAGEDRDAIRVMTIHKSKGLEFPCVHLPFNDSKEPAAGVRWFEPAGLDFVDRDLVPPLLPLTVREQLADTAFAPAYRKMTEQAAVDNANVVYVAFTRAVSELTVGFSPVGGSDFSRLVRDVLDVAMRPEFAQKLRERLPEKMRDPYVTPTMRADGCVECGAPTLAQARVRRTTLLDPTDTVEMPPAMPVFAPGVWNSVQLDEDSEPTLPTSGGIDVKRRVINEAMKLVATPDEIERTVRQMVEKGRVAPDEADDFASLIEERVSGPATARWFTGYIRLMVNRSISLGKGNIAVADRVVWLADGSVEVVMYERPEGSDAAATAGYIARKMTYAGMRRVSAWVWDTVTGRVTQVNK